MKFVFLINNEKMILDLYKLFLKLYLTENIS